MRRGYIGAALVILATLAPLVSAMPTTGTLRLEGPVSLPAQTIVDAEPLAFLAEQTEQIASFSYASSEMLIEVFERRYVGQPGLNFQVPDGFQETSWAVANPRIDLIFGGNHAGFLGLYPTRGGLLSLASAAPIEAEARSASVIASHESSDDSPSLWWYYQEVGRDHVFYEGPGRVSYEGPGSLKISGPDVRVTTADNVSTFRTGVEQTGPAQHVIRWIHVTSADATIYMDTGAADVEVAAARASVEWSGAARLRAIAGSLVTGDHEYHATGTHALLSGTLTGRLLPLTGEAPRMDLLDIRGDLAHTTLSQAPKPTLGAPPGGSGWVLAGALGLVAATAGGIGAVRLVRQRPRRPVAHGGARPLDVPAGLGPLQELRDALDSEEWTRALRAVQSARAMDPQSASLALTEATILKNLDCPEEALEAYDEAALLAPDDHEPMYWAACLCIERNQPRRAIGYLVAALQRLPDLGAEVQAEAFFAPVQDLEPVRVALADAREAARAATSSQKET